MRRVDGKYFGVLFRVSTVVPAMRFPTKIAVINNLCKASAVGFSKPYKAGCRMEPAGMYTRRF